MSAPIELGADATSVSLIGAIRKDVALSRNCFGIWLENCVVYGVARISMRAKLGDSFLTVFLRFTPLTAICDPCRVPQIKFGLGKLTFLAPCFVFHVFEVCRNPETTKTNKYQTRS